MAPMGMRNMAKNLGPTAVVPVAIAFPTAAISIRQMMWIERSLVLAEVNVTRIVVKKVANCLSF
jgi:hypothetical protein